MERWMHAWSCTAGVSLRHLKDEVGEKPRHDALEEHLKISLRRKRNVESWRSLPHFRSAKGQGTLRHAADLH
eukprot:487850-Pelagomonas_calceolata.AAC.5